MSGHSSAARLAAVTCEIDLGRDSQALGCPADEFMAEYTAKTHVATAELQIRIADSGRADLDEKLVRPRLGLREIIPESDGRSIAKDAPHLCSHSLHEGIPHKPSA
jgi:hypothetical protein